MSKTKAQHVADLLVHMLPTAGASGAGADDLVDGYRLAADRVAAWRDHRDWPTLRDDSPIASKA